MAIFDNDSLFKWPEFDNHITDEIEIIDQTEIIKKVLDSVNDIRLYAQRFLLTSFEVGPQNIPPFKFVTSDSTYVTDSYNVMVNTVEVDTSKGIYDVKPIIEVDYSLTAMVSDWFSENWYWFVIGILLIGLIIFIHYL